MFSKFMTVDYNRMLFSTSFLFPKKIFYIHDHYHWANSTSLRTFPASYLKLKLQIFPFTIKECNKLNSSGDRKLNRERTGAAEVPD